MTSKAWRDAACRATGVLLVAMGAASFATGAVAQSPAAARTVRIGILSSGTPDSRGHLEQSLLRGLAERGYVEGRNLIVERRYAGALGPSRTVESAKELAAMNLDAVVTTCSPSTTVAKQAMPSTSIIMAAVSDPVGHGLISSLARPGGNITGVSSQGQELLPKMIELFSRVLPRSTTIAVLGDSRNPVHAQMRKKLHEAAQAQKLDLRLVTVDISGRVDLEARLEAAVRDGAKALFVLGDDPLSLNLREQIVGLAQRHGMPAFYWAREFVDAGGLMSYGESLRADYGEAAGYVARLAKGARPADLPVQQPRTFELVINRKTARTLNIVLPQDLLIVASDLVE